jgi:hypothetical protein
MVLGVGKFKAAVLQRRLDSFAALLDGDVGQAHHIEIAHAPGADVHFDLDNVSVNAKHSRAERLEEHG